MNAMWKQFFIEAMLKTSVRSVSSQNISPKILRTLTQNITRIFPEATQDLTIESTYLGERLAEKISPNTANSNKVILYIHGGGFCLGSLETHRAFVCQIAKYTQIPVIHFEYSLAPEQPFPKADEEIYQAYQDLIDSGFLAEQIILAGDDAGANLALTLALRLIRQDANQPCGLMLLSPFLDLTLTSDSVRYNKKLDALLSPEFLKKAVSYYAPQPAQDVADPRISPLYADLTGLPPTLVQVGSKSLLLDDATRFKAEAKKCDVPLSYKIYTGMWHNFFLFNEWFETAQQSLKDMSEFTSKLK